MDESLIVNTLKKGYTSFTPSGKKIASYLLTNLNQLPFETHNSIARATGITGISVGRFLRQIGFQNLEDLTRKLRTETGHPWMLTDRLDSFRKYKEERDALKQSMALEMEAIEYVYQLATTSGFTKIADRIVEADAVFIAGIQGLRGIAISFFGQLELLRPKVYYADGASGAYVESLNSEFENPYIIIADFQPYASITRRYCQAASKRNIPLLLITDFYCTWAQDYPIDLLQLKVNIHQIWDAWSPLISLQHLFLSAVAERLGPGLDNRLAKNKELQKELGQWEL